MHSGRAGVSHRFDPGIEIGAHLYRHRQRFCRCRRDLPRDCDMLQHDLHVCRDVGIDRGKHGERVSNTASSQVTHLFVIADNQTIVYGSPNPAPTFKVYGDVAGSLNTALVSCAYSGDPRNVGSYPITCTGPATTPRPMGSRITRRI